MTEFTTGECQLLLHCLHNALWMRHHEAAMRAADPHILLVSDEQASQLSVLMGKLVQATT